jgi:hypothetical protein
MKTYLVTGYRYGIWCTITVHTTPECIATRAAQCGMTDITNIEEA